MDTTYEGSIYDPDTLHKYLYANGNPVTYSDSSGNMFDFASTTLATGIQSILNNAVQISYRGVMCGLINMTLTAVMGGSWEQAKSSFVAGFIMGAGISAVRYFAVGAELVTLARFYVLSASANFIFSTTVTLFAITQGYSDMAVMFGVMAVLSIAEWCWAYGNYLLIDVYGNKGCATIECDPSGGRENSSKTIDDIIGRLPENTNGKGVARNFESTGGFDQTIKDFDSLNPVDVKEIQTQYGTGKVGKLSDGTTVVARPGSTTGGATLEIRVSNSKVYKIRY